MIKSINDVCGCEGSVVLVMSQENALRVLHFANFGEATLEAVAETYKGNKQGLDLKMDNLEDLKTQLNLEGKKVSNLVVV